MIKRSTFLAFFAFIVSSSTLRSQSTVMVGNTELDVRDVITGIDIPWEIIWGPDDHIWFTERIGRISRVNPETGVRTIILNLTSSVYQTSESGLLGMVLHPDFENTPQVFVAYTYLAGINNIKERVVRYEYNGTGLVSPLILLDNIVGWSTHNGSRMMILPDNTLLMSTGDAQELETLPQSTTALNGKFLRMNLDGSIPSDNPFGADNYTYSYGHRNPQGIVLAPNGKLYSSEHGPTTNDEFNIIEAGKNYGWPLVEGYCNLGWEQTNCNAMPDFAPPITIWTESATIAPSDLIYYEHPSIPEWQGRFLMTVLKNKHLRAIKVDDVDGTEVIEDTEYLTNVFGRLRDICTAPDGRIFLATNGQSWSNTAPNTHKIVELKNSSFVPSGLNEAEFSDVRVYPNPATNLVEVALTGDWSNGQLLLTDPMGRTVASQAIQSNAVRMNLGAFVNGIYSLTASKNDKIISQRIIINR